MSQDWLLPSPFFLIKSFSGQEVSLSYDVGKRGVENSLPRIVFEIQITSRKVMLKLEVTCQTTKAVISGSRG
jgi:hypothetical protein